MERALREEEVDKHSLYISFAIGCASSFGFTPVHTTAFASLKNMNQLDVSRCLLSTAWSLFQLGDG